MSRDAITGQLATANQILANEGILGGFGHVTVRHPDDHDAMLVSLYQSSTLVTDDDIVAMSHDGEILDDRDVEMYSETAIHRAIYRHRDDVNAVVHHHAPAIMPFTFTDVELLPVFHMGAIFHEGVPTFDDYDHHERGRLIVTDAESDRMAAALGDRRAQLLEGHGANVTGSTLKEAVVATAYLVMNAEYQLEGEGIGNPRFYTGPEESVSSMANDVILKPRTVDRMWNHLKSNLPQEVR